MLPRMLPSDPTIRRRPTYAGRPSRRLQRRVAACFSSSSVLGRSRASRLRCRRVTRQRRPSRHLRRQVPRNAWSLSVASPLLSTQLVVASRRCSPWARSAGVRNDDIDMTKSRAAEPVSRRAYHRLSMQGWGFARPKPRLQANTLDAYLRPAPQPPIALEPLLEEMKTMFSIQPVSDVGSQPLLDPRPDLRLVLTTPTIGNYQCWVACTESSCCEGGCDVRMHGDCRRDVHITRSSRSRRF